MAVGGDGEPYRESICLLALGLSVPLCYVVVRTKDVFIQLHHYVLKEGGELEVRSCISLRSCLGERRRGWRREYRWRGW